jgi:hypothetical protein
MFHLISRAISCEDCVSRIFLIFIYTCFIFPNTLHGTLFSIFVLFRDSCKTVQLIKCRSIRNSHLLCTYAWVRHHHLCGRPWQGCDIPLAMQQPNWRCCSMCRGTHRSCSCAQSNILDPKYLGCTGNTVRIFVGLCSCNDRGVFRAPIRTSWAHICSLTRSLWRNDEAGRENVCSMASLCEIANVVGVIICLRRKQYWQCVESPVGFLCPLGR